MMDFLRKWVQKVLFTGILKCRSRSETYCAHCDSKWVCCDPNRVCCDHCNSKWVFFDLERTKNFMRLCAAQRRYVAALRDPNKECCDHCYSKLACCDFMRQKHLRDFAKHNTDILRLCATQKRYVATIVTQNWYVATLCHPKQICCKFTRPKKGMLRFCATHASCGMMEIRSQKVHFGDPFRSQHKSRTSTRKIKIHF